ncbi:MAG: SRPBCC domain-containing protein [Micropepsaceae bacterium]
MFRLLAVVLVGVLAASTAQAKVAAQNASGFSVALEADVTATPQQAWDSFVSIGNWWDMDHSYSHDGKNMKMDPKPGGAWIETLPNGGFVTHLTVSQAAPGARLVLNGGLGPLAYMGVNGALTVGFAKTATGTHIKLGYAVGGFDADEFKTMSKAVDGVWTVQFARYVSYANTGKP